MRRGSKCERRGGGGGYVREKVTSRGRSVRERSEGERSIYVREGEEGGR